MADEAQPVEQEQPKKRRKRRDHRKRGQNRAPVKRKQTDKAVTPRLTPDLAEAGEDKEGFWDSVIPSVQALAAGKKPPVPWDNRAKSVVQKKEKKEWRKAKRAGLSHPGRPKKDAAGEGGNLNLDPDEEPTSADFEAMAKRLWFGWKNLRFFIENFLWVENKETGALIPFKLNLEQLIVVAAVQEDLDKNRPIRILILKPRQIGVSTLWEAIIFWASVYTANYKAKVILDKREKAEELLLTTKRFRDLFPKEACLRHGYDAKKVISVDNSTILKVVELADKGKPKQAAKVLEEAYHNPDEASEEALAKKSLHSRITIEAVDSKSGHSTTTRAWHCSEVARWPGDPSVTFSALKNSTPAAPRTFIVIESTAQQRGDYFYNMWRRAERGESGYKPIFFPWFSHPEYTSSGGYYLPGDVRLDPDEIAICRQYGVRGELLPQVAALLGETWKLHPVGSWGGVTYDNLLWRRWCIANNCEGSVDEFHRNYPCDPEEAFVSTGANFFPKEVTDRVKHTVEQMPPLLVGDFQYLDLLQYADRRRGEPLPPTEPKPGDPNSSFAVKSPLAIWQYPVRGRLYVVGGDSAQGKSPTANNREPDWSVLYTMDAITGVVCARYRLRVTPDILAEKAVLLARYYNDALLGIETNEQGGGIVANQIATEDFGYWNMVYAKNMASATGAPMDRLGWYTHAQNRGPMLNYLLVALSRGTITSPCPDFYREMISFARNPNTGKMEAAAGEFDDCVMALAITNMVRMEPLGLSQEMLDSLRAEEETERKKQAVADPGLDWVLRKQQQAEKLHHDTEGLGHHVHPVLGSVY